MRDDGTAEDRFSDHVRASSLLAGTGVNTSVLSQEERKEYAHRLHDPLPRGVRARPLRLSLAWATFVIIGASLCVTGAALLWGEFATVGVAVAVVIVGYAGGTGLVERVFGAARQQWAAAYLAEIGYEERLKEERARRMAPPKPDDPAESANPYWFTGEYNPARHYSFSKVERDIAKAYGMDADHWEANRPD